jgi:hypothetical protein
MNEEDELEFLLVIGGGKGQSSLMDPPYSEQEAKDLYGLQYVKIGQALNEAARVLKDAGVLVCLHRLVPQCWPGSSQDFKRLSMVGVVGVFTLSGMSNIRACTVWRKQESIYQWLPDDQEPDDVEQAQQGQEE